MLKVRVAWDRPVDLKPLVDEIHETFGDELLKGAIDSTPVDTGYTLQSWHKTRIDEQQTEITNDSYTGGYQILSLLHEGTKPHFANYFNWHAAGYALIGRPGGYKVSIKPDRIALKAVKGRFGLQDANVPKQKWQAVEFYSYRDNLTSAIEERTELACRRMNK
jgi:hypothetical protein